MYTKSSFRFFGIILAVIGIFWGAKTWIRHRYSLPRAHVGAMEANHPWMIFDPTIYQGLTSPYADKQDPNVVYLVLVDEKGAAIKIDLKTKTTSPYKFNVIDWKEVDKLANKYTYGFRYDHLKSPVQVELRGQIETRTVGHMFGYPWPDEPGMRKAILRSGYYYITDERDGKKVELLRVKVQNSELDIGSLGSVYISPDKKWLVFRLSNLNSRVFIFDREANAPEVFQ